MKGPGKTSRRGAWWAAALLWLSTATPVAAAQAAGGGSLRPYVHIFLAYAAAWIVVVLWVLHISRRLGRIENSDPS